VLRDVLAEEIVLDLVTSLSIVLAIWYRMGFWSVCSSRFMAASAIHC
jgi:hypothetical protein